MAEPVVAKQIQQRQIFALLLALGALGIPLAGAAVYGSNFPGSSSGALGAVSFYDSVPVLMLVGALALLVITASRAEQRSRIAVAAGVIEILAAGLLTLAYLVSAFSLRANGELDIDPSSSNAGWSLVRVVSIAALLATAALCAAVLGMAGRWIGTSESKEKR